MTLTNKHPEAAIGGVLWEKMFLEILQNSHENTCARVSFLIKLQALVWKLRFVTVKHWNFQAWDCKFKSLRFYYCSLNYRRAIYSHLEKNITAETWIGIRNAIFFCLSNVSITWWIQWFSLSHFKGLFK